MSDDWLRPMSRLGAAALVGALVGGERQLRGSPAGLRTHMLVSLGAAIVIALCDGGSPDATSHVIQGVATGIGFLCAGEILHRVREGQEAVRGLTSAASLWVTAALGMSAALGRWALVVVGGVATLVTLSLVQGLERVFPAARAPRGGGPSA